MRHLLCLGVCCLAAALNGFGKEAMPHLARNGDATQLIVDGKPFIMIAGELHNSSASDPAYLTRALDKTASLNANTVLAPVSWELFEPEEGRFDNTLVDHMIREARARQLKLVILWFGSWKNGVSSYAPEWVLRDTARFPRARGSSNRNVKDVLSTHSDACRDADTKAFAALMRRIRKVDTRHTVIAVQVENEMGIRPEIRDLSETADAAYRQPVPAELMEHLARHRDALHPVLAKRWETGGFRTAGAWEEVFGGGAGAEELFSVWHYARYTQTIAAAGKREHPLPLFVNAWLPDPGGKPGNYPSGGPVVHVHDIWRAAAPDIDIFAPDIYLNTFKEVCADFTRNGNPLLIPEAHRGDDMAARAYWAFGHHGALCFAPFGIESVDAAHPVTRAYAILRQLVPLIGAAQGTGRLAAFYQQQDGDAPQRVTLGDWRFRVSAIKGAEHNGRSGAILIQTAPDELIIAGHGFELGRDGLTDPAGRSGAISSVEMGRVENGAFIPELRLNGDESGANNVARVPAFASNLFLDPTMPRILRVRMYRY